MENHLVLFALGENCPQVIEKLCRTIKKSGFNIIDSRMTVLGQELMMLFMLCGSWNVVGKFKQMLPDLQDQLDIDIHLKPTQMAEQTGDRMPYVIDVISLDRVGIVHEIVDFLTSNKIDIQDLNSHRYQTVPTGTSMFSLHISVNVPANISIALLRSDFIDFCDRLNFDAIIEPAK